VAFSFAMVSSSIGMSTYPSLDGFASLVLLFQNIGVLVVFFFNMVIFVVFFVE